MFFQNLQFCWNSRDFEKNGETDENLFLFDFKVEPIKTFGSGEEKKFLKRISEIRNCFVCFNICVSMKLWSEKSLKVETDWLTFVLWKKP